jgi:hypothetical protein
MKHTITLLTVLLLAPLAALRAAEPFPQPSDDLITGRPAGPWRRLFLDATVVEEQQGVRRVFHAVEKHPASPVLVKDKAWEGAGPYIYGTVMCDVRHGAFLILRGSFACHRCRRTNTYDIVNSEGQSTSSDKQRDVCSLPSSIGVKFVEDEVA